jgi:hypothetical protein
MESGEEYRQLARNCLRLAENATAADRGMLIKMAQIWHRLAEEKERTEAQEQDRPSRSART